MRISWLIVLLFTALSFDAAAETETITIVADKWCPYNCGEEDAKQGYMVEIVRQAMKKYDINVIYKVMPWSQALEETRAGKYEAVVGANRGDAPDFIFPDVVQGISINLVWMKADSKYDYKGLSSLDGLRVGTVASYSYGKAVDPYLKKRKEDGSGLIREVSRNNATDFNIEELLAGRIDALLEDKNVIEYYFASRDIPITLKPVGNPVDINHVEDTYLFVAFGPNNPKARHYANLLTYSMQEMRKSGQLKAILSSYNVNDAYRYMWKPKVKKEGN